jgi:hypothetical protein
MPLTCTLHVNLYIFTNNGRTMTMTNDRPDLSSEGAPDIDKTILVNVNRNKYPVVGPTWALKPGLTDRLVVGRNVTFTLRRQRTTVRWYKPRPLAPASSVYLLMNTE